MSEPIKHSKHTGTISFKRPWNIEDPAVEPIKEVVKRFYSDSTEYSITYIEGPSVGYTLYQINIVLANGVARGSYTCELRGYSTRKPRNYQGYILNINIKPFTKDKEKGIHITGEWVEDSLNYGMEIYIND